MIELIAAAVMGAVVGGFIPDERGVKVRYSEASVERRVKAETPKEVG